jgi:NRPS condensation-like uncharacterized protein
MLTSIKLGINKHQHYVIHVQLYGNQNKLEVNYYSTTDKTIIGHNMGFCSLEEVRVFLNREVIEKSPK